LSSSHAPDYADIPDSRRLARELAAEKAKRVDHKLGELDGELEAVKAAVESVKSDSHRTLRQVAIVVLSASIGVMTTVTGAAVYVGARFERIEGVAREIAGHDRRIERLEEKAMVTNGSEGR
jgi:hypothetical protein